MDLTSPIPSGPGLVLEPYAPANREALRRLLDQDAAGWAFFLTAGFGAHLDGWWDDALAQRAAGVRIPYAARQPGDAAVVATSSFQHIDAAHRTVEIGATFIDPAARGGDVNPRIKRLMLAHAFAAGALRVQLVTDARNLRSQAAIAKLGAVREGVLRASKVTWTGHVRDTVVFSILPTEWPVIRDRLDARIAAGADADG